MKKRNNYSKKHRTICQLVLCLIALCACVLCISGCSNVESSTQQSADKLKIASLKGPTSIGLLEMMRDKSNSYEFEMLGSADAIVSKIAQEEIDIALLPANLSSTLYSKTNGNVSVIDINTLGVLYGITQDESINTIAALKGKTLYMTGKGTVPEYTLSSLLSANGLSSSDVNIEYKSEPAEVISFISKDPKAIGILPEPYATQSLEKDSQLKRQIDLTQEWKNAMGNNHGDLITGVTIVRKGALDKHADKISQFLQDHKKSVDFANNNSAETAQLMVDNGLANSIDAAQKAIPNCNVVYIDGNNMKTSLSGYLKALFEQNPESIGGSMPRDDFYYTK